MCPAWLFDDDALRDIPPDILATWHDLRRDPDAKVRARATLALARAGDLDDRVTDGLIEVFLANVPPSAGRAWNLLQQPERRARFLACRRQRAGNWQTPEEAFDLLYLWADLDDAAPEHDVLAPLLRAATTTTDVEYSVRAAVDLWHHDRPFATDVLLARSHRSLTAATFLYMHGEPGVEALLWHALEQAPDDSRWKTAAVALIQRDADAARLIRALTRIAGRDGSGAALWLLHGLSPTAALCGLLEHLACARPFMRSDLRNLAAMAAGCRPGAPPLEGFSGILRHHDLSPREVEEPSWRDHDLEPALSGARFHAPGLHGVAMGLIRIEQSAALSPGLRALVERDLPGAMAALLGDDAAALTRLWQRASAADVNDIAEIRSIVDGRAKDVPGQRLARLWWLLRLPAATLLERDEHDSVGGHGTPLQHLAALLKRAYPDEPGLRRVFAELGLTDELVGPPVKLVDLRQGAAGVLLRRGLAEAVIRCAVDDDLLRPADLLTWQRTASPDEHPRPED